MSASKVTPPVTEMAFVVGPMEPATRRGRGCDLEARCPSRRRGRGRGRRGRSRGRRCAGRGRVSWRVSGEHEDTERGARVVRGQVDAEVSEAGGPGGVDERVRVEAERA